jgi:hypothetical protein
MFKVNGDRVIGTLGARPLTRFQVSREYYYWRENHLRSSFCSDVATTPFVRNLPQTFHARTLSRVDLCISFHLSI